MRAKPFVLALAASLAACGGAGQGPEPSAPSGAAAGGGKAAEGERASADFTTRDIQGKTVHFSDYLGKKVILVNFWATYCEPCLQQMPHLERIYQKYKDQGLVVLGVSMDGPETVANVQAFARRNYVSFPVVYDEDSHIASLYNPKKAEPLTLLVDKGGKVVRIREGYNPGDEDHVEKDIAELLKAPAAAN